MLSSLQELLDRCEIVISLVTPSAALQVATEVAALARNSACKLLYVDANSTTPAVAAEIAQLLSSTPCEFLDAAVHGVASQLRERGVLYLSGPRASELASQIGSLMRVKVVGAEIGQASALKMILSGMSKGLIGLFVETMVLARELNLRDDALEGCEHFYPGAMEAITRILPTYPQHAARRRDEMLEIEEMMRQRQLTPRVISGVRAVIAELAGIEWEKGSDPGQYSPVEIVDEVHRNVAPHSSEKLAVKLAS